MSTQITLPLGLNPNDVDVGDLSLVIGRSYNVTNIEMENVGWILGSQEGTPINLKLINRNSRIKSWSAFKPTTISGNPTGLSLSGDNIIYNIPEDSDNYRLEDWAGYNHTPPTPGINPTTINIGYNNRSHGSNEVITRSITVNLPEFDIRIFNANATQVIANSVYTSRGFNFDYHDATTITNTHLTNKQLTVNYRVLSPSSGDITFHVQIWLGNNTNNKLYKFPNGFLTGNLIDGGSTSDTTMDIILEDFYPGTHQSIDGSFNVITQSSVSWTTSASETWISMPPQFGTGNGTVVFDLLQYTTSGVEFRGGYITVQGTGSNSDLVRNFIIIQPSEGAVNAGYTGGGANGSDCSSGGWDPVSQIDCIILSAQQTWDVGT